MKKSPASAAVSTCPSHSETLASFENGFGRWFVCDLEASELMSLHLADGVVDFEFQPHVLTLEFSAKSFADLDGHRYMVHPLRLANSHSSEGFVFTTAETAVIANAVVGADVYRPATPATDRLFRFSQVFRTLYFARRQLKRLSSGSELSAASAVKLGLLRRQCVNKREELRRLMGWSENQVDLALRFSLATHVRLITDAVSVID